MNFEEAVAFCAEMGAEVKFGVSYTVQGKGKRVRRGVLVQLVQLGVTCVEPTFTAAAEGARKHAARSLARLAERVGA